jgi:hypothetical protein
MGIATSDIATLQMPLGAAGSGIFAAPQPGGMLYLCMLLLFVQQPSPTRRPAG